MTDVVPIHPVPGESLSIPDDCTDFLAEIRRAKAWPKIGNVEAEAALIGALMIDNSLAGAVTWLEPEAFFEPLHQRLFSAIMKHVAEGRDATPITLKPEFLDDAAMKSLGGPGYLAQLTGSHAGIIGFKGFARQIDELYRRRLLFEASIETARRCYRDFEDPGVTPIVEGFDEAVSSTVMPDMEGKTPTLGKAWDTSMERYDDVAAGKITPGMKIDGLDDLNELLGGGLRSGNLIVLAGRPGMGKTALAVTAASSCARAGLATHFNSLEMSTEELTERQISDICYVHGNSFTYDQLKKGTLSPFHRREIDNVRQEIDTWPLTYDDTADMRVGHLIGKLRRQKRKLALKGVDLKVAIIDYLQLLKPDHDTGNEVQNLSNTTRSLKLAAKDMGIAIILLSQLNRGVEQRDNKRPQLSDLRGSGSIEQDADAVIFLFREEYYLKQNKPDSSDVKKQVAWDEAMQNARDRLELIAAKVRGAETGSRKCYFFGAHQAVRASDFFTSRGM